MNLQQLSDRLSLEVKTGADQLNREVTGGYASDLLSCVMAKAQTGNVWITLQGHPNIVAVASLLNLTGIIVSEGVEPDEATVSKAAEEKVPLLTTPLTTYTVVGRLYELGISGVDS